MEAIQQNIKARKGKSIGINKQMTELPKTKGGTTSTLLKRAQDMHRVICITIRKKYVSGVSKIFLEI